MIASIRLGGTLGWGGVGWGIRLGGGVGWGGALGWVGGWGGVGHSVGWGGWGGDTDTYTHMIASIRLGGTLGWGGVTLTGALVLTTSTK